MHTFILNSIFNLLMVLVCLTASPSMSDAQKLQHRILTSGYDNIKCNIDSVTPSNVYYSDRSLKSFLIDRDKVLKIYRNDKLTYNREDYKDLITLKSGKEFNCRIQEVKDSNLLYFLEVPGVLYRVGLVSVDKYQNNGIVYSASGPIPSIEPTIKSGDIIQSSKSVVITSEALSEQQIRRAAGLRIRKGGNQLIWSGAILLMTTATTLFLSNTNVEPAVIAGVAGFGSGAGMVLYFSGSANIAKGGRLMME